MSRLDDGLKPGEFILKLAVLSPHPDPLPKGEGVKTYHHLSMRIIAGKFRGRRLKSPPSLQTRPTSDRLRETLFNIVTPRIADARLLDLCAGSGAIGIEALSRGAGYVTFVDQSRKMCDLIEANLQSLEIEDNTVAVISSAAVDFLKRFSKQRAEPFDIIFFDPPYATNYEEALEQISEHAGDLLARDGVVIVEHHKKRELAEEFGSLRRYRVLKQGDSCLSFYERS